VSDRADLDAFIDRRLPERSASARGQNSTCWSRTGGTQYFSAVARLDLKLLLRKCLLLGLKVCHPASGDPSVAAVTLTQGP
jgi:hypothetical protein